MDDQKESRAMSIPTMNAEESPTAAELYATIKEAITNVANVRSANPLHSMLAHEIIDEMARNAAQGVLELIRVAGERQAAPAGKGHVPIINAERTRLVSCSCGLMFTSQNTDDEFSDHLARVEISKGR
jgi:hypothetical protein